MSGFLKGNDPVSDKRKIDRYIGMYKKWQSDPEYYKVTQADIDKFGNNMRRIVRDYKRIYGSK